MSLLDPLLDLFRGKAVTIPPMDGALRPNTLLDDAEVVVAAVEPDNLALFKGKLIYTSGHEVRQVPDHKVISSFASTVTALAVGENSLLAVGLDDGTLKIGDRTVTGFNCITALTFHDGALYVCNGSADLPRRSGPAISCIVTVRVPCGGSIPQREAARSSPPALPLRTGSRWMPSVSVWW